MSMIDQLKQANRELGYIKSWHNLIGKHYKGGGGGEGKISKFISKPLVEVYYQEYDGAKNYHEMPPQLAPYLDITVYQELPRLLPRAINLYEDNLRKIALAAQAEYKEIEKCPT